MMRISRTLVGVFALPLFLVGCGSDAEVAGDSAPNAATESPAQAETAEPAEPAADPASEPRTQEETCSWDDAVLSAGVPDLPAGEQGTLSDAIIGSWQHTHFDTGSGFEPVEKDIRYVFPSSERLLYCQHVPGVTDHAENASDFTWDGNRIALPGAAPGFTVNSWSESTMLWTNHTDDSTYLLQRR